MPAQPNPEADAVAGIKLSGENAARLARLQDGPEKEALAKLLETTSGAIALLDEAAKPGATPEIVNAIAAAGAGHPNAVMRDLLQRLLPPAQRRRTLGTDIDPQDILTLKGDDARGKILFHQEGGSQCARCHRLDGLGREYGPDLTNIGRKYTRAQVLEQIILPSKIIAPEFKTYFITLRDDTELTGFIVKHTAGELVLHGEDLIERRLKAADVKETRESAHSSMPEGLLAPLTAQEAADLLEYLEAKNR
jgi:putative heme-binding domain-containing protein